MRHHSSDGFRAFSEYDGYSMISQQKASIIKAINSQNDDYILNVNKEGYIQHLISEFRIDPIEIYRDELTMSVHEEQIAGEMRPNSHFMDRGVSYSRDVIKFHLPFTGDKELLKVRASSFSMSAPVITIEDNCICFKIINLNLEPQRIKQESENTINDLINQNGYLTNDLNQFNSSIESVVTQAFDSRKQELLNKNDLISAIGVPIRKSAGTSNTFSIPAKRTQAIATKPKPTVTEKGYTPEPALDETIYGQILKVIHDVGKQFERLPSTYAGKEEEHLRDHILLILEPNFEGSATGETFNKSGKTDILLRHEGSNVFIAELKFWHGQKGFLETITQLLGYLTWRDSKAAVVIFVRNKNLSSVLETAQQAIKEHENYLGFVKEQEEGWYHYRFHINGDQNREVKLSLMLFHIPE